MLPFLNLFFIEVELIYNVVLVSSVQQSDSVLYIYIHTHTHSFSYFSIMIFYKILNTVCCTTQWDLVVYLFYV